MHKKHLFIQKVKNKQTSPEHSNVNVQRLSYLNVTVGLSVAPKEALFGKALPTGMEVYLDGCYFG